MLNDKIKKKIHEIGVTPHKENWKKKDKTQFPNNIVLKDTFFRKEKKRRLSCWREKLEKNV
jgi:hypothetical protein